SRTRRDTGLSACPHTGTSHPMIIYMVVDNGRRPTRGFGSDVRDPSSPRLATVARRDPRRCVARGHRMAVPAIGRCVCGGWPRGGVPAPGLPVVRRAAGVLVGVSAVCPGGRPVPEDLRA